jgi:hypothetical protein
MVFGDLAAEDQPDAGAGGLRREEGDEEILHVGNAGAVVLDVNLDLAGGLAPADADAARGLAGLAGIWRGFDGVLDEVDEDLFDLGGVAVRRSASGPLDQLDRLSGPRGHDALA